MRPWAGVLILVAAAAVSGCAHASGTVAGRVTIHSGPVLGQPTLPRSGVNVVARSNAGDVVATAMTDANGRFTMRLSLGSYTIGVDPDQVGCPSADARVSANTVSRVTVACVLP